MNWENSSAITPLKRDFLRAWFAVEERFFLTGGSALGIFYLDHRFSYDLDLFSPEGVEPLEIQTLVRNTGETIGADVEPLRSSPDFHRFRLSRGEEREVIDLVIDRAPQLDDQKESIGGIRVDTVREIIANKLTTLVSRSEMKDIVDLFFLEKEGHDLLASVPDAQAKDGGREPAVVSMLLANLEIQKLPDWLIRNVELAELQNFLERLRLSIARLAIPD